MENKFLIASSVILVIIIASVFFFLKSNASLSPTTQNLEECKNLIYNGENKINILLFSSKEKAEEYSDYFFTISPFDKNNEAFNFYYIDDYSPECELYKGIALLCQSKELTKKSSSCPNDYVVVIKEESPEIRSSSYLNVLSINSNHPSSVLPHEFGHAFAILAEEYTPASIPSKSKNCVSSCDKFSDSDGCFQGCSKENYYRSTENGIMRTLSSSTFGIFDENLILEKIISSSSSSRVGGGGIIGSAISSETDCSNENYYLVEGIFTDGKINILGKTIEQGCVGTNGNGFFGYKLISEDNSISADGNFNPELIFTDAQSENEDIISGQTYESDKPFYLKIPLIENSKSLQINKDNQIISEINLQNAGKEFCKIK